MVNKKNTDETYSFLFKINSECNDFCSFCLEHESIELRRPRLTFLEFKKNYNFLRKKFSPNYVIISGGEPTLHPDFFKMMDFLKNQGEGIRFITNLITLSDLNFAKKIKKSFSNFENLPQKKISKVIVSINDAPLKNENAQKRYTGLKNLLDLEIPLVIVVTIYNGNSDYLCEVSWEIRRLIEESGNKAKFNIELRMIYFSKTISALVEKSLPGNSVDVKKSLERSLEIFNTSEISTTLWNFPLCYLKNHEMVENSGILERKKRKIIRINVDEQCENFVTEDWFDYFKKTKECQNCSMTNFCTGMDVEYIEKNYYPKLKAFVKNAS